MSRAKALSRLRGKVGWRSVALALTLAACTRQPATPPPDQPQANATTAAPTSATPAPPAAQQPQGPPVLTAQGWGPLKVGMTRAEITAALGPDANPNAVGGADPEQCDQFRPARAPEGMLVMVEAGRLTRISLLRAARVKTDRGLGLGASAAEVRAVYGKQVHSTPHKYGEPPQEYLTVWATGGGPADRLVPPQSRGIVYEVDGGGKVGAIHAGGPSILYVEGCS